MNTSHPKYIEALTAARSAGYTIDDAGRVIGPGKFEGETVATLYFYDAMMNGDGESVSDGVDAFDTDVAEREAFNLPGRVLLSHDTNGFVYLHHAAPSEENWNHCDDCDDVGNDEWRCTCDRSEGPGPIHLDRSTSLTMDKLPEDCIKDCSASGDVGGSVKYWRERLGFTVEREAALAYVKATGSDRADADQEPMTDDELAEFVLWQAACSFSEFMVAGSNAGSDVFTMEA